MKHTIGTVQALHTPLTAKVSFERQWQHPLYLKSVKRTTTLACHVPVGIELHEGDSVEVAGCRPYSKTKTHIIVKVVGKPS